MAQYYYTQVLSSIGIYYLHGVSILPGPACDEIPNGSHMYGEHSLMCEQWLTTKTSCFHWPSTDMNWADWETRYVLRRAEEAMPARACGCAKSFFFPLCNAGNHLTDLVSELNTAAAQMWCMELSGKCRTQWLILQVVGYQWAIVPHSTHLCNIWYFSLLLCSWHSWETRVDKL